jgi:hypothetical protein
MKCGHWPKGTLGRQKKKRFLKVKNGGGIPAKILPSTEAVNFSSWKFRVEVGEHRTWSEPSIHKTLQELPTPVLFLISLDNSSPSRWGETRPRSSLKASVFLGRDCTPPSASNHLEEERSIQISLTFLFAFGITSSHFRKGERPHSSPGTASPYRPIQVTGPTLVRGDVSE